MAILKYTNKNGEVVAVNSYKINNVIVSQYKGQSTAEVMSQKAVTDELELKANVTDIPTSTSQLTNDSGYLTEHQPLTDYYNKTEADTKFAKLWSGTQAEYDALTTKDSATLYVIK